MRRVCCMPCAAFGLERESGVAGKIRSAGCGLFLLWVGVSLLMDLGWGIGLLGVGFLTLAMQAVRHGFGLEIEGFWVLVGSAFTLFGIWALAAIDLSLGPILLIGFGVFLLGSALLRARG